MSPDSAKDPLVTSQSGVWCNRIDVSHLVVKLYSLYICRLVRLTHYACSPAIDGSVLTVAARAGEWVGGLGQGLKRWGVVLSV